MDDRPANRPGPRPPDVLDSDDPDHLRVEILRLRDELAGADSRTDVLADRIEELELQVEKLAAGLERYQNLTAHPAVKAVVSATRPFRRFVASRRTSR